MFIFSHKLISKILPPFKSDGFKRVKLIGIQDLDESSLNKLITLQSKSQSFYHSEPIFYSSKMRDPIIEKGEIQKEFYAVFEEVEIIGESNIILLNNKEAIYPYVDFNSNGNVEYLDTGIEYSKNDYALIKSQKSPYIIDEGFLLLGNFSWNYYHIFMEILPRFESIEKLSLNQKIPIIVDKKCYNIPQVNEAIKALNKDKRRVIELEKGLIYKIKRLHYVSPPNYISPSFIKADKILSENILINQDSLKYLRDSFLSQVPPKKHPKRIYLSRTNSSGRRKFNENEIFEVLKKYGFDSITPENYTLTEQISLFNQAEYIVGGSGAAFTNLIFCNKKCKVIIFAKTTWPFSGFSTIAHSIGFSLLYITEKVLREGESSNLHASFKINPSILEKVISDWVKVKEAK